jgi:putative transposase
MRARDTQEPHNNGTPLMHDPSAVTAYGHALHLLLDAVRFLRLCLHSPTALAAENLFLRKQLALYQERQIKPRRATAATRYTLVWLSQWFNWRQALTVVQPETFRRWRRQGLRQCWRCAPSPGRSPIPGELQSLIRQMACDNLTWG